MSVSLRLGSIMLAGTLAVGLSLPAFADDAASTAQPITVTIPGAALDSAIRDFLKRNPEAVADALSAMQAKQEAKQADAAKAAITSESGKIYNDPNSPVAGNSDGKETLVEFFDYQCHYCKQVHPDLQTLLKDDPNLKIIYKDFPILGPGSLLAAKAALAAKMQGKYLPMHDALLDAKGQIDDAALKQIAQTAGLDYDKLKADMDKPEIMQQINDNMALADKLNIHGTPSLIINHQFYGGALPLDDMKQKLKENKDG